MIERKLVLAAAALCAGLGATPAFADDSALAKFPGAKDAIMSYYAANAREGSGNCGAGQMTDIGDARVVNQTADSAVLAVSYGFSASVMGGTTAQCSGDSMREFTLQKGGSGWTVNSMSGQTP